MIYCEAPNTVARSIEYVTKWSLFLGGGISNCPDWQKDLTASLSTEDILIFNPRRSSFDVSNPLASRVQITWEYVHLREAKGITFWFPEETLCPIVLFEYGYWLCRSAVRGTKLFVGIHPNYKRKEDVEIQTELLCGYDSGMNIEIVYSLEDMSQQIKDYLGQRKR